MKIANVLVEIDDMSMNYNKKVKVFINFDQTYCVGLAKLYKKEDGLYADFFLKGYLPDTILWPAIGYCQNPNIINQIGLCTNPNVDPKIPCFPNS